MADNTYSVGYATNARAKCKYSGCGDNTIAKDSLRFVKGSASAFSEKPKAEYYHVECMFLSFVRARKTTKKIESMKDIEGAESMKPEDKENIKKLIKQWKEGDLKDKVPKITRKRKGETDKADSKSKKQKKAKDSSSESEEEKEIKVKPKAKASPVKRKPTKKQRDSDDDSEDDYKETKKRKTTKNQKDSDSDSEDDDKVSKMIRKPVSKRKDLSSSESDSEPKLKIQLKDTKNKKKVDSDEESEEVTKKKKKVESDEESEKVTKKKKKIESDEEIDETSSSEKQNSPKSKPLSGHVIALSGKLSKPSAEIAKLIEKNGGTFSKTITKDVTHVICAKMDDKTQKLTKAKEDGKILVDEKFLKKKINL